MDGHETHGLDAPAHPELDTFPCPECGTALPSGTPVCPSCGIRLTGQFAAQLWRINTQIGHLSVEARRLRGLLLQPPTPSELAEEARARQPLPSLPPLVPGVAAESGSSRSSAPATPSLSGQQILLGIGALLLLSGVAFFLVVVWTMVGLIGQALIMVFLTGLAATGAALATRKRLSATAQTAGVIASGLLVLDLWSAHRLGLAGLDRFDAEVYWTFAAVLGAGLLMLFDAVVPRRDEAGDLRHVVIYRPGAVLMLTAALWAGFFALELDGLGISLVALVVAVLSLGLVWVAQQMDRGAVEDVLGLAAPTLSAAIASLVYLVVAIDIGYDANPVDERAMAMALLLIIPALLFAAQWHPAVRERTTLRVGLRALVLTGAAVALGVPVMGASREVVAVVAVVLAVLLTGLAFTDSDGTPGRALAQTTWGDLFTWAGRAVLPLMFWLVFLLAEQGMASGIDMRAWVTGAGPAQWWLPVLPALAFVVPTAMTAVRRDSILLAIGAHIGAVVVVLVALRDAEEMIWAVTALVAAVLTVALAAGARWAALEGRSSAMESLALLAAAIYATVALGAAFNVSAFVTATVLLTIGALLLAYAALPDRFWTAYLATIAVTAGVGALLGDNGVDTIEYYTAPAVLMLAGIGAIQWLRDSTAPTMLTMGPALAVGVVPSLAVALVDDSSMRLVAVTLVSILLLLIGMAQGWQAPVIVAGAALVILAVTQGGPLIAYVDGWVTLTLSGLLLLLIGVMWERSINMGRRASAWLNAMQ